MSHPSAGSTHEVFNQSPLLAGHDLYAGNRPMQDALRAFAPALADDPQGQAALHALGREAGDAGWQCQARLANQHGPRLLTHDRQGHRVDEVEFHPAYHALMGLALRHGLHGTPWAPQAAPGAHVQRAAAFMLATELEPSVLCPVSMSYAVAPALRANPALHGAFGPLLACRDYDSRQAPAAVKRSVTMGMGMTEKQGGSDVRANTTQAVADGQDAWGARYRLRGHKWFMSAPMSDAFLVLAQTPAGPTCFFVPHWGPDGHRNPLRLQRLKHKLGNHANASSEVEFDGTLAWRVGDDGRGLPQILEMGALTRLDCALGTAGLMRQALSLALDHACHRRAFGQRLVDQPLMRNVLADLALESEAATVLALRVAAAVDRSEHAADPHARAFEQLLRRVLTPVAKFWVCKRGAAFAQEAMECLGGNGYVEAEGEGVMARVYREMPLNSIWEGAGNIMALDLQRALRTGPVRDSLAALLAPARGSHPALDRAAARVLHQLDDGIDEAQGRRLAADLAQVIQAALLVEAAPAAVADAFCAARLQEPAGVFGLLPAGLDLDALIARALPR